MLRAETARLWGKPFLRVSGLLERNRLIIWRPHRFVRNSFRMFAFVNTNPGGRGTTIEVTLRSAHPVAAFMTFWLGLVTLFNVPILIAAVSGGGHIGDLLFTVPFLLFGFGLLAFGRLESLSDRPALLDFIRQTTGARDMPLELGPSS